MTLHFTEQDQADYEADMKSIHFTSSLGFLNAHNGLRRGATHLVMGTTGGGKSTLIRTLIRDILFKKENQNLNLGIWLSEESLEDYKRQIAAGLPSSDVLLSTQAFSEIDQENVSELMFFEWLEFYKPDILLYDNITTSQFYMDMDAKSQAKFVKRLKAAIKRIECAGVIIAHTDGKVNDSIERLIELNDIRGSKSICNLTEFAYILQRFQIGTAFFPTIRTVKHRSQDLVHNLYSLHYDKRLRAFTGDTALEFNKFKEMFQMRNKLGGKK